jgi:hypothetical protein
MLKLKIAGLVVAGLLSGAAGAAESVFPSSAPEHPVGPANYSDIVVGAGVAVSTRAAESPFPSSGDEFASWLAPRADPARVIQRLERTHGNVFPSSSSEIGS